GDPLPERPLLPAQGGEHPAPAAARPRRRHPAPRPALPPRVLAQVPEAARRPVGRSRGPPAPLRVAGQRARAAQPDRARRAAREAAPHARRRGCWSSSILIPTRNWTPIRIPFHHNALIARSDIIIH